MSESQEIQSQERIVPRKRSGKRDPIALVKTGKLFKSYSSLINEIEPIRDNVMRDIEAWLVGRSDTAENRALAELLIYYDSLSPASRSKLSYEELCEKFSVRPEYFYAAFSGGLASLSFEATKQIATKSMVPVMQAVALRAMMDKGTQDAKLLFETTGLIENDAIKVNIGTIVGGSGNQVQVNNDKGIPDFIGQVIRESGGDTLLRESYRQALSAGENEVRPEIIEVRPEIVVES